MSVWAVGNDNETKILYTGRKYIKKNYIVLIYNECIMCNHRACLVCLRIITEWNIFSNSASVFDIWFGIYTHFV